jgi:hypothetical protein
MARVVMWGCTLCVTAAGCGSGVSAENVRRLGGVLPVSCGGGRVGGVVRGPGPTVDRKNVQNGKRQKGRDGGVQTHRNFGGAERQSIFYTNGSAHQR